MVVIVFGLPGTGKSFFAARLADQINADYINSDRLRMEMFPHRTYSDKEKGMVYKAMLERAKTADNNHKNVVLDATFYKNDLRKMIREEIGTESPIFFIEVTATEELVRERLQKKRPYSEADFEVYRLIERQWEVINEPHLTLNSADDNIDTMLQDAIDYLHIKK